MKVALVGPELEENLGLRYLHAAICAAGHDARIIGFHGPQQTESVSAAIAVWGADVVGLSMVFTARAKEFVNLACLLRGRGFSGHIVAGGHFASFHSAELLHDCPAIDFIVHGEGEFALIDLLENIHDPGTVAGISYREPDGTVKHTGARPNPADLDILPWPTRNPPFYSYMGIPIANILGSRGCFGNCSFCSITAWYRQNSGPRFRQRSVNSVVLEMAHLYHSHGVRIFNFHDDTFFHPDTALNIERFAAMENALQNRSMTDIAIQVKARTDAITPPVLDILRRIGLFRVFLGVENHSADGLKSLGKGTTVEQNRRALNLLRAAKLHATFNLLMFGPDTTFDQLRENIASIREFGDMPVNFGRVEVYSGTPLERDLRHRGRLKGDFFGYHYEIADPLVQNIFEIFRAVFTERNFQVTGMNFAAMKLDYYHQILAHFHPAMADEQLFLAKKDLIERLNRSNADLLSRICDEAGPNAERNRDLSRRLLRMRRNYDRKCAREFEALIREIEHRARSKNIAAGTLPKKAVAVTAAAAAILISSQRCNINVTVDSAPTAPRQPDTINRQAELPQLDSSEVALVEQRINSAYKTGVDSLGSALGFVNRPLQFNLCLDSSGSVDSCAILHPARDSAPAFADAVLARIRTWTFPDIRRSGTCGITMVVASEDTGWHICEIIGYPLDSVTPPPVDSVLPPLAEYRGADSQMVINKFYADYIGAVDSLCSAYGCIGRQFSIRVVVDSAGRVINCTVSVSGADTLPPGFAPAVSSLALGWRFPGVSRKGYCVITTGIIVVVPPTIYEIMAFPRDTNP